MIDFEKGRFETSSSRMGLVSKEVASTPLSHRQELSLFINQLPLIHGTEIVCLQVVFFEEKEEDFMQLKEKVHGMGIVGIASFNSIIPLRNGMPIRRLELYKKG